MPSGYVAIFNQASNEMDESAKAFSMGVLITFEN
jgi:hypothetical protein